jgi:hypothetical protein
MPGDDAEKSVPSDSAVERQEGGNDEALESRKLYPIIRRRAEGFFKFIFSHRMIPILKGTPIAANISSLIDSN